MACAGMLAPNQTLAQRMAEVDGKLKTLATSIGSGIVRIGIGANGAIVFSNWNDRAGLSDACAYRALSLSGSWELRQAVARAEAMTGRKINANAVASGVHSHDGGRTFHNGH